MDKSIQYHIILFGKPSILADGTPVKMSRAKSKGIVFYLAAKNKDVSRDKLQDLFWPELEQQAAQHNLNVHLSNIRKQLPGLIESDSAYVRLREDVTSDCLRFDTYFDAGEFQPEKHQAILNLYQGEFLEGFSLSGSGEFDTWKAMMREHYLNRFLKGLLQLAEHYQENDDHNNALMLMQNAIQIDPLQENIYRSIMQLHYENGDFLQANSVYQKLKTVLDEEIGLEPMPETRRLYEMMLEEQALKDQSPRNRRQHFVIESNEKLRMRNTVTKGFVGMKPILERISQNITTGRMSLLCGIEGSGKTTILNEIGAGWDGIVIHVRFFASTNTMPYAPILNTLIDFLKSPTGEKYQKEAASRMGKKQWSLVEKLRDDGFSAVSSMDVSLRLDMYDAVSALLTALSQLANVLILLDDLDRADNGSVDLLTYFTDRCAKSTAFVASMSPLFSKMDRYYFSAGMIVSGFVDKIFMSGFTLDDVRQVMRDHDISEEYIDKLSEWLWSVAGRNPYQLIQMLHTIPKSSSDQTFDFGAPVIPAGVKDYFEGLKVCLTKDEMILLELAAAYGSVFNFEILRDAQVLDELTAIDCLDSLIEKGIFRSIEEDTFEFFTVIMRETVYGATSYARRRWMHLKIAEAIERQPDAFSKDDYNGLCAHHFTKSTQPKRATDYAMAAGNAAFKRSAWHEAVSYYEIAKKYCQDNDLLIRYLTSAYISAGEIKKHYRLSQEYSEAYIRKGEMERYYTNRLEVMFAQYGDLEEFRWGIIPGYYVSYSDEELQLMEECKPYIQKGPIDVFSYARFCMMYGICSSAAGNMEEAAFCFERVTQLYDELQDEAKDISVINFLCAGVYKDFLGDKECAEELLRDGIKRAAHHELVYAEAILRCEYGNLLYSVGKGEDGKKQLDLALKLSRDYSIAYVEARSLLGLGRNCLLYGDGEQGIEYLRNALGITETIGNCKHLKIYILNELLPYFSEDEKTKWENYLNIIDCKRKSDLY